MLSIGAFAQVGQVTHHMLRHWDQAGLLVPAHIDPFNGYRSYDPSQLDRLHRIVALRRLGFNLDAIGVFLADDVDAERLGAMLRIRRTEVEAEHRTAAARLVDVQRRFRLIEQEQIVTNEIVEKSLPAVRLAADTAVVSEQPEIAGVIGPMFGRIAESWQSIHTEIIARGLVPVGQCRELYVRAESDDQSDGVTELQQPVANA